MNPIALRRIAMFVVLALAAISALGHATMRQPAATHYPADIPGYWAVQRLHPGTPEGKFVFVDGNHGWATSPLRPSVVYRTSDGGATWQPFDFNDPFEYFEIHDLFFVNAQEGWATGTRTVYDLFPSLFIAHTGDGGQTWRIQLFTPGPPVVRSGERLWFVDAQHGWVEEGATLWRTTDGGQNWIELQPIGMPERLLRFVDTTTGFGLSAPPGSDRELMRTTDGGETWFGVGMVPDWVNALWVDDNGLVVWAVGADGRIARSPNRGATWTPIASPTTHTLNHLVFADSLNGWAAGEGGAVLRTTDGGWNWSLQPAATTQAVSALAVADRDRVWIYAGALHRTRDGGAHWTQLPRQEGERLSTVRMASSTVGWAGGTGLYLLKTTNGRTWVNRALMPGVTHVEVVDEQHAWVLAAAGFRRTTDGGANWTRYALPVEPADFDFVNATLGWLVGRSRIYQTTNAGQSWMVQYTDVEGFTMQRLSFVDAKRGWALGSKSGGCTDQLLLLRTTDGGRRWSRVTVYQALDFTLDIDFVDATHGWMRHGIGAPCIDPLVRSIAIARTTDGGLTWEQVQQGPFYAMDFLDAWEGWVVGEAGLIRYTTNGGSTWLEMTHSMRLPLYAVHATGPGRAWIVGDDGLILGYSAVAPPGCWATPTPLPTAVATPPVAGTVQRRVAHCMDDTYVRVDIEEPLYDLNYVRMGARRGGAIPYVDGFLFRNVPIPQGSRITAAYLELNPLGYQSGVPIIAEIVGDRRGQSDDFNPLNWPVHLRPRTNSRVPWTIPTTVTGLTRSPDIAAVVQEIVDQPDWRPGNNLTILVAATEASTQFVDWQAYDFRPTNAAALIVSYQERPTATPTASPTPTSTATPRVTATPTATPAYAIYLPIVYQGR